MASYSLEVARKIARSTLDATEVVAERPNPANEREEINMADTTDTLRADDLPLIVRRQFVVQERYCCRDKVGQWADDPEIRESVNLDDAIKRLETDNAKTRGHAETWDHRIIERTETVVWIPPKPERIDPPTSNSDQS